MESQVRHQDQKTLRILGLQGQQLTKELIESTYKKLLLFSHPDQYSYAGQEVHAGYDPDKISKGYTEITKKINQAKAIALKSLT